MHLSLFFLCHRALFRHLATFTLFLAFTSNLHAGERPLKGDGVIQPAAIYHNYCSVCHGDRGDGRSRASNSLSPAPRDFTNASDLSREFMIAVVTHGKVRTAMTGWQTQLNTKEIETVVDYIRQTFMVLALDPRLQRGKLVYTHNCASCHGDRGQGSNSVPAGATTRDLTSPQARADLSHERILTSVTNGRPGTTMPGFAGRIDPADIAAVVDYMETALLMPSAPTISGVRARTSSGSTNAGASLSSTTNSEANVDMRMGLPRGLSGNTSRGGKFFNTNCATCHGIKGDGQGPRAKVINPAPLSFLDARARATLNRPALFAAIASGKVGTEMPAWSAVLEEKEIADVTEYVFRQFIRPKSK